MQRCLNYGSYLQAWGLKHLIEELGCKVEFVDIPGETWDEPIKISRLTYFKEKYHGLMYRINPSKNILHYEPYKMNQNRRNGRKMVNGLLLNTWGKLGLTKEFNDHYDCDVLVIGSDEMFNCTMDRYQTRPMSLFGMNVRCRKKITYAVSFGDTTIEKIDNNQIRDSVTNALNSFNVLSVRDNNSCNIVQQLTGITPYLHLDPVLMYEFPEIDRIRIKHKNYIAVYGYGNNINDPDLIHNLRAFAKKNSLKLLAIGNGQDFCDETVAFSPFEVLAYMKHATYAVTNTFHGAIFSLKYGIPFVVQIRNMNKNKLGDLISRFQVSERIITESNVDDLCNLLTQPFDKVGIQEKIKTSREITRAYLRTNILGE